MIQYMCIDSLYILASIFGVQFTSSSSSSGAFGPETHSFFKKLGHRLYQATLDPSSHQNLLQEISVAVQKGDAAAVLDSLGKDVEELSNYFS